MTPRTRRLTPSVVRARLTAAADKLTRDGEPELSDAVQAVLAPRGWELLKNLPATGTSEEPNLAMWMNKSIKDAVQSRSLSAGEGLRDVVEEGLRRFVAGKFVPEKPLRSARGSATAKVNLNTRVTKTLLDQVAELCPARSEELGWRVTPGLVAMSWLYSEYGITDDDQRGVTAPALPDQDD